MKLLKVSLIVLLNFVAMPAANPLRMTTREPGGCMRSDAWCCEKEIRKSRPYNCEKRECNHGTPLIHAAPITIEHSIADPMTANVDDLENYCATRGKEARCCTGDSIRPCAQT